MTNGQSVKGFIPFFTQLQYISFRFLWPCIVSKVWRERNSTRCNNQMFIPSLPNYSTLALGSCDRASWAKCEEREIQQDATIRCLSTSVSTCFGHHYAHLQEIKDRVTEYGVLFWFCWMWLVAVVGCMRCRMWALINLCFNMFRASLCPSSGEQRSCYCIWCAVLVLLDVVGSGCGVHAL